MFLTVKTGRSVHNIAALSSLKNFSAVPIEVEGKPVTDDSRSRSRLTIAVSNELALDLKNYDLTDFCGFKIPIKMIAENYFANELTLYNISINFILIEVHYLIKNHVVWGSNNSN